VAGVNWGDWVRAEGGMTADRDLLTDVLGRIRAETINPPLPEPSRSPVPNSSCAASLSGGPAASTGQD
jgi:hypothetical protein